MKKATSEIFVYKNILGYYKISTFDDPFRYRLPTGDIALMTRMDLLKVAFALLKMFLCGKGVKIIKYKKT